MREAVGRWVGELIGEMCGLLICWGLVGRGNLVSARIWELEYRTLSWVLGTGT